MIVDTHKAIYKWAIEVKYSQKTFLKQELSNRSKYRNIIYASAAATALSLQLLASTLSKNKLSL